MERSQIQSLIKQCAGGLFDLACAVSGRVNWDLSLPVGVIDARRSTPKLMVTAVGTINSMVRASATIGHPLMRQFFERMEAMGVEQALKESFGGADADFTSFQVGACYLNIASGEKEKSTLWGRVIFYVDDVDKMYQRALKCNMKPLTQPADAPWGERYFHLRDPDENELSFAKPLDS